MGAVVKYRKSIWWRTVVGINGVRHTEPHRAERGFFVTDFIARGSWTQCMVLLFVLLIFADGCEIVRTNIKNPGTTNGRKIYRTHREPNPASHWWACSTVAAAVAIRHTDTHTARIQHSYGWSDFSGSRQFSFCAQKRCWTVLRQWSATVCRKRTPSRTHARKHLLFFLLLL